MNKVYCRLNCPGVNWLFFAIPRRFYKIVCPCSPRCINREKIKVLSQFSSLLDAQRDRVLEILTENKTHENDNQSMTIDVN